MITLYSKDFRKTFFLLALKSATNKPAQDIFNELIDYALENSMVEKYDGTRVKVSDIINLVV